MQAQRAYFPGEDGAVRTQNNQQSIGPGVILFAMLSPLCAVCGFILAEIFGFAPF